MAKKVVHYLKGIIHLELVYRVIVKNKRITKVSIIFFSFRFIRYRNNSYIRDSEDRNSIIGYYYFMNGAIVLYIAISKELCQYQPLRPNILHWARQSKKLFRLGASSMSFKLTAQSIASCYTTIMRQISD